MTQSTSTPEARPDLQELAVAEALADHAVGVRHDAEAHAGRRRASARPARHPGDLAVPQRGVGELAVEVQVHLLADVGGDAAALDVALEVARASTPAQSASTSRSTPKRAAAA